MPVSYPNEMRKKATREGTQLVTIDALGMHFQGPVSQEFLVDEGLQRRKREGTVEVSAAVAEKRSRQQVPGRVAVPDGHWLD